MCTQAVRAARIVPTILLTSFALLNWATSSRVAIAQALPNDSMATIHRSSANLNSIVALSEDRLCAVGDRGSIMITENAGRNWQSIDSGTSANLTTVVRLSPRKLIAVGGWYGQLSGTSHAVILLSENAGANWQALPTQHLPFLNGGKQVGRDLIVWGDRSPHLESGVFRCPVDLVVTEQARWLPVVTPLSSVIAFDGEISADGAFRGFAFDSANSVYDYTADTTLTLGHINDVTLGRNGGIAVGAEGRALRLDSNLPRSWSNIPLHLTENARASITWKSIASYNSHHWIAGTPGSIMLHSSDSGKSWETLHTDQRTAIHDLAFIDERRGWAVGELGNILATRDGGHTWYAQQGGANRVGILSLAELPSKQPWPVLSLAVWNESQQVAICNEQNEPGIAALAGVTSLDKRILAAAATAGVGIQRQLDFQTLSYEEQIFHLAALIRSCQPDVLLLSKDWQKQHFPWQAAIEVAATTDGSAELSDLGLPPWRLKKVASFHLTNESSLSNEYRVEIEQVMNRVGLAVWDTLARMPVDILNQNAYSMRTIWSVNSGRAPNSSLLGGVATAKESQISRPQKPIGNYQLIMGRNHRRNSLHNILQESSLTLPQWQAELGFLLKTFPQQEAKLALHRSAELLKSSRSLGKLEALLDRAARNPDTDIAAWAIVELLKINSSEEWQGWLADSPSVAEPVTTASGDARPGQPDSTNSVRSADAFAASPFSENPDSAVQLASGLKSQNLPEVPSDSESEPNWLKLHAALGDRFPATAHNPQLQLLAAKHERLLGNSMAREQRLLRLSNAKGLIGWPQIASQELAIDRNSGTPNLVASNRWNSFAVFTPVRPNLDGLLDETCWTNAPPIKLENPNLSDSSNRLSLSDQVQPDETSIRWAYDDEYLYIAIVCPKSGNQNPQQPVEREYDADISTLDRVLLLLDVDRDYNSAVRFGIAESGQTTDRLDDCVEYNPKWHLKVAKLGNNWIAEGAIAIQELGAQRPLDGTSWGMCAARHGNTESESWSLLRSEHTQLQAAGILHFQPRPIR